MDEATTDPPQGRRFGPLRSVPPEAVLAGLSGAPAGTEWVAERIGDDGGYPNGGLWRVSAARANGTGPTTTWVKRTSAHHLGTFRAWRLHADPNDPHWWGREATFYESDLATSGWPDGIRAAHCYAIDDHDNCRDLWLESVAILASREVCERAVAGLAAWQVAHQRTGHAWVSHDWIPTHVRRHELDNARTLSHPAWPVAIARGFDPMLRDMAEARVTDPSEVERRLAPFPQVLTHYDFHARNIGTAGDEVAIIDWAYVGWGPIGHDAGHLAKDLDAGWGAADEAWHALESAYCDGLTAAGWSGDLALVRKSMAVSNFLRLGWVIDHLLDHAERLPTETLTAVSDRMRLLAKLL